MAVTYREARRLGYGAAESLHAARILSRWDDAEEAGLVRWRFEPDPEPDLSFLEQEEFEPGRAAMLATVERDGVWVAISEFRAAECPACGRGGGWEIADSLGGLIGDPETEEGFPLCYRVDLAESALNRDEM